MAHLRAEQKRQRAEEAERIRERERKGEEALERMRLQKLQCALYHVCGVESKLLRPEG